MIYRAGRGWAVAIDRNQRSRWRRWGVRIVEARAGIDRRRRCFTEIGAWIVAERVARELEQLARLRELLDAEAERERIQSELRKTAADPNATVEDCQRLVDQAVELQRRDDARAA